VAEPLTYELFRSARRHAVHLEMRDSYTPDDPDWREWRDGHRFNPAQRWRDWFDLMRDTTSRGVRVRRARIVSEPVTDYIRFEYDVTADHNIAAGEQVRRRFSSSMRSRYRSWTLNGPYRSTSPGSTSTAPNRWTWTANPDGYHGCDRDRRSRRHSRRPERARPSPANRSAQPRARHR
jgi:hypothetical protein